MQVAMYAVDEQHTVSLSDGRVVTIELTNTQPVQMSSDSNSRVAEFVAATGVRIYEQEGSWETRIL